MCPPLIDEPVTMFRPSSRIDDETDETAPEESSRLTEEAGCGGESAAGPAALCRRRTRNPAGIDHRRRPGD